MSVKKSYQVLVFFLILVHQTHVLYSQVTRCNQSDLNALQGFLNGLESSNLDWNIAAEQCCTWVGITCGNNLKLGLSSSDSSLKKVVTLDLDWKNLKGLVSKQLGDLDQMQVLNLSYNALYGSLPRELFNLQDLKTLDLSGNRFSGSMASFLPLLSMQNQSNLTKLFISKNLFDGHIDAAGLCKILPQLQELDLSSNLFLGTIPQGFGNCKRLVNLFLGSNGFSGSLPDDLFELSLRELHLQNNQLSGLLDERMENISTLYRLDVSNNRFHGHIPELFSSLRALAYFSASSNNFSGPLPITLSSATRLLVHLDVRNNSLQDTISINCTQLPNLSFLDLSSNQFAGTISENISLCTRLKSMNLAENNLNGLIPESLKKITSLSYLSLSNNGFQSISATLRILQRIKNLATVVLAGNFKGEEMPTRNIKGFKNLKVLSLPNCSIHGRIPLWLRNLTNLAVIDLSRNQLTGNIPLDLLSGMSQLSYLNLSHNQLTGEVPKNLTVSLQQPGGQPNPSGGKAAFAEIKRIGITPLLPFTIFNFLTENLLYEFLTLPPSIDLSSNQFNGAIPAELGDLKNLVILDLSWNSLSEAIPENFSKFEKLESLDLSHNKLTGRIPSSLVQLTFLSRFDVSNNNLEGEIPQGGQFSTFPNSSFEGNLNLCGDFHQPCSEDPSVTFRPNDDEAGVTLDRLGLGVGAAFGFFVTVIVCAISGFCFERDERVVKIKLLMESKMKQSR